MADNDQSDEVRKDWGRYLIVHVDPRDRIGLCVWRGTVGEVVVFTRFQNFILLKNSIV